MKGTRYCYSHHLQQVRCARKNAECARQRWFESAPLEDAASVQRALTQVMTRLLSGNIAHERAGQLLYKLQTASVNLRTGLGRTKTTATVVSRSQRSYGNPASSLPGPQLFRPPVSFASFSQEASSIEEGWALRRRRAHSSSVPTASKRSLEGVDLRGSSSCVKSDSTTAPIAVEMKYTLRDHRAGGMNFVGSCSCKL